MDATIDHDETAGRFTLDTEAGEARLDYALRRADVMDIHFTWTPPALRGGGIAGRLVRHALEHARGEGWRVVPSCGYVAAWMRRHPEFDGLRAR